MSRISDEIISLQAIYESIVISPNPHPYEAVVSYQFQKDGHNVLLFEASLPTGYPDERPPVLQVTYSSDFQDMKLLNDLWQGAEVLYDCMLFLEDFVQSAKLQPTRTETLSITLEREIEIVSASQQITDRKSVFQGHVAVVKTKQDVDRVVNKLLQNSKVRKATHNMMAYVCGADYGYDDDGESGAGQRILSYLQSAGLNEIVVIVSRWYGGTQLGSVRFHHIVNAAQMAIQQQQSKNYKIGL